MPAATYNPDGSIKTPATPDAVASGYDAATGAERSADASNWAVNKDQTVAGQLHGLLSSGSDYRRAAVADATQTGNRRGLLNSSMMAGAGTQAAIRSALPIATQDASTNADANRFNADNTTRNNQFNANLGQSMLTTNLAATNRAREVTAGAQTDVSKFNTGLAGSSDQFYAGLGQSDRQFYSSLNQADRQFYSELNSDERKFYSGLNQADRQFYSGLNQADKQFYSGLDQSDRQFYAGLSQSDKQFYATKAQELKMQEANFANMNEMQKKQFTQDRSMFDLDAAQKKYMQSAQFTQDEKMFGREEALKKYIQSNEFDQQIKTQAATFAQQTVMQTAQFAQDKAQFGEQAALQKALQSDAFKQAKDMFALDEGLKKWMVGEDSALKTSLAGMDVRAKKDIAEVESNYKTLIQTSASATDAFRTMMPLIANVMNDKNMDADAKKVAINKHINDMKTQINLIGSINGVNTDGLLDFGEAEVNSGGDASINTAAPGYSG